MKNRCPHCGYEANLVVIKEEVRDGVRGLVAELNVPNAATALQQIYELRILEMTLTKIQEEMKRTREDLMQLNNISIDNINTDVSGAVSSSTPPIDWVRMAFNEKTSEEREDIVNQMAKLDAEEGQQLMRDIEGVIKAATEGR